MYYYIPGKKKKSLYLAHEYEPLITLTPQKKTLGPDNFTSEL